MDEKKAIIIGASSGIGWEVAKNLSSSGYCLGLMARRVAQLEQLQAALPGTSYVQPVDIRQSEAAQQAFHALIAKMQGVDLLVISAGTGYLDEQIPWEQERETIAVNVFGFTAMANAAYQYFTTQGRGHIVAISSIAAIRGGPAPAYNASKAYISNYLQGLRLKVHKAGLNICITEIQPGFVDTAMAKGDGLFWLASAPVAAKQICLAIQKKKKHVYVTRRWRLIAWLLKMLPDAIYHRIT